MANGFAAMFCFTAVGGGFLSCGTMGRVVGGERSRLLSALRSGSALDLAEVLCTEALPGTTAIAWALPLSSFDFGRCADGYP